MYLGLDPGLKGGLACIRPDGIYVTPMPTMASIVGSGKLEVDAVAVKDWIAEQGPIEMAAIELVGVMPKQGVVSCFTFGDGFGALKAILRVMNVPFVAPRPQKWKKIILEGTAKDKTAAIAYVKNKYPSVSLLATERCRTPHDGIADAICLAEYARFSTK